MIEEKTPKVVVVIVTWNSQEDIATCLESIRLTAYPNLAKVIVVDNNSSDRTTSIIKEKFSWVHIIENNSNTYFTGGNNIGFRYAIENFSPTYVITLNPDTKVEAHWVDALVGPAEANELIGIVAPKIMFFNNKNTGKINSAGLVYDGFMQAYDRGVEAEDQGQFDTPEFMQAVSGTCMLLRVEMLQGIGMFWEKLRMYLEDVELCIRARKYGWEVLYTPATTVQHSWMQSTNQSKNVRKKGWMMRNWVLIALRHYPLKSKLAMIWKWVRYHLKN